MPKRADRVPIEDANLKGFERVEHVPKSSYRDNSMVIIVPSREPWLHRTFVERLNAMQYPMNQRRAMFYVTGAEVGKAYTEQIQAVLAHPELSTWKYVLTIEDDNLPPPEGVLQLLEAIDLGPFDGIGGLYYTKGELNMPMCYGDPVEFARTGVLDFRPRDVAEAIASGGIMPCNGIANGFSLFRMQLFKDLEPPWFVTNPQNTQDLYMCANAARRGKRFAAHCGVRVAHMDWATGEAY